MSRPNHPHPPVEVTEMKTNYNREAVGRLVAAASKVEASLWAPGVSEDDLTPEHGDLIQALAAYNSQPDTDIGWPPAGHEPPTAAEWYEPEGAQP